jgi:hypothetical protein
METNMETKTGIQTDWREWVMSLPDDHVFNMGEVKSTDPCGCLMIQHGKHMGIDRWADFEAGGAYLMSLRQVLGVSLFDYGEDSPFYFTINSGLLRGGDVITAGQVKKLLRTDMD